MLKIFALGLLISFAGTLPLGTLNITAFQIATSQSINEAVLFAIAVVIVEIIVVAITLYSSMKINLNSKIFIILLPIGVFLLTHLAISSFASAYSNDVMESDPVIFPMIQSSFALGLLLSIINPMHFPFWMSWNGILMQKNKLINKPGIYPSYIIGIATGSITGLMLFIISGNMIFQKYQNYHYIISITMGFLYFILAIYLVLNYYKLSLKKLTA